MRAMSGTGLPYAPTPFGYKGGAMSGSDLRYAVTPFRLRPLAIKAVQQQQCLLRDALDLHLASGKIRSVLASFSSNPACFVWFSSVSG